MLLAACMAASFSATPAAAAPGDPYVDRQWHLPKIEAQQAWPLSTGAGALVAVVDSGVDLGHPDLAANVVAYPDADLVEPAGECSGGKDRICTQDGARDENGHGTHVGGIIAAVANNGVGVAGVAPDAKLLPVRVLDETGSGSLDHIAAGIDYASQKGARVINLSLGYASVADVPLRELGFFDMLEAAVDRAHERGAVLVVAAGNDSVPLCTEPAHYPNVICVGATDQFDLIASYSNSDALHPNYVTAPGGWGLGFLSFGETSPTGATCGGEIFSTYLRGQSHYCSPQDGYEGVSGTSMAAPVVSGIAALLAAAGSTNVEIIDCIKATADDLGPAGRDPIYGHGRVNAHSAATSCTPSTP